MGLVVRIAAVLLLLLAGVGAGFAAARDGGTAPIKESVTAPLPAEPSLPVDALVPYAQDIDYPTLATGLPLEKHLLGPEQNSWRFRVPKGWQIYDASEGLSSGLEARWRPVDEPEVGGYSVHLRVLSEHGSTQAMVAAKDAALSTGPYAVADYTVLSRTDNTLSFTYRTAGAQVLRYNTFRWVTAPGGGEAKVEISVAGRERDAPGLGDLLARTSASVKPA